MRAAISSICCAGLLLCTAPGIGATDWLITAGSDDLFHPADLTVAPGDSITWYNADEDNHTSTSGSDCTPDGIWDSGDILPGAYWGLRFNDMGTFPYHCFHHCALGMVGVITVENPVATEPKTWSTVKALYR